jgi:hypothetical protein
MRAVPATRASDPAPCGAVISEFKGIVASAM